VSKQPLPRIPPDLKSDRCKHSEPALVDELLSVLLVQVLTGLALFCLSLGISWITEGSGMHPLLAGLCAMLFIVLPYLLTLWGRYSLEKEK
jgi:hypothetical protein